MIRALLMVIVAALVAGCDTGIRQMGSTEYALKFRKLPGFLGGGLGDEVALPGQTLVVWPWEALYRFDTAVKYVSWGAHDPKATRAGRMSELDDYVYTRALDGNEVALAVTVQYRISPDASGLRKLIENVATNDDEVEDIVITVARADIRTFMNELKTSEFFLTEARYKAVEKVRHEMQQRMSRWGIEVQSVILNEYRFERQLPDGSVDRSYQTKIDETQKLREDTERERLRVETIRAKKSQELNETQAQVNRSVAEAEGYKNQAVSRGDSYFNSKSNEAKGVLAVGRAEVEGLSEQIRALSGPGGMEILKLRVAEELIKSKASFVAVGSAQGGQGIDVRRTDTAQILEQVGLFEALREPRSGDNQPRAPAGEVTKE